MFELIAGALSALNQVGLLFGGALCAGVGALLLGSRLHWRFRAIRVTGTIVGVRQGGLSGKAFYPVYQYALPNGVGGEATSETGVGSPAGMNTGRQVPVLVFPSHPDQAADAGSYVSEWVGAIFLVVGGVLFYIALTAWPISRYTWIVVAGFVLYGASKFRRVVPRPGEGPRATLTRTLSRGRIGDAPVRPVEEIVNSSDSLAQQEQQKAKLRKAAPMLIVLGLALLGVSAYVGKKTYRLVSVGGRATGKVVDFYLDTGGKSTAYFPVVRFTDPMGQEVQFRDGTGSNPPSYRSGDTVKVMYLRDDPAHASIDRGGWNWLPPGLLLAFAMGLLTLGVRLR